jgi:hypothetical protein
MIPPIAPSTEAQGLPCGLAAAAFCDTFDAPAGNSTGTRSGDLDAVVWGVSHTTSNDNVTQNLNYGWAASQMNRCGSDVTVAPPRDVQTCNGQLVESINDQGAVAVLAMYPRQPFDIAGRTGRVAFDVANDTQGSHMAWPVFIYTDQPVPAPYEPSAGVADLARNSFGFALGADCKNGQLVENGQGDSFAVSEMFTTTNYSFTQVPFQNGGCVRKSSGVGGAMNHVEIRLSPTHAEVWVSDPGAASLKMLASADLTMPLTRGLVWMEDAHYNACKDPGTQCNHTFAWDNFGFDGPVLQRDLGFDIPDQNGASGGSLGWKVPTGQKLTLQVQNVHDVASAQAALFEFTWWALTQATWTIAVNGNPPHVVPWQYGNELTFRSETLAVPIPVNELHDGTNSVTMSSTDSGQGGTSIANIDIILAGAGGGGSPVPTPSMTPTSVPPTAAPQVTATATVVPTDVPTATAQPSDTPTTTPTSVDTATPTPMPTNVVPTATPVALNCTLSIAADGTVTGNCQ